MKSLRWLAFLGAAAFLVARAASFLLAAALEQEPMMRIRDPKEAPDVTESRTSSVARLFGISPGAEHHDEQPGAPPPTANRRLRLLALLVSDHEALSTGFIMDEMRTAWLVRPGDAIGELRVERMSRDPFRIEVWNQRLQRREYITGGEGPVEMPPPGTSDIQAVDSTHHVISRARVDATLANLGTLAQEALWMPLMREGRTYGWQVRGVRPGSLLESIGLRSGDTVLRINGLDLNGPGKALEAYQRLRDSVVLDVDIERGGAPVRMNYRIDG